MPTPITVTFASGMLESVFGKLQAPLRSYITQFGGIQRAEEEMWDKIFVKHSSSHFAEGYSSETDIGDMVAVAESGDYPSTSFQEGYPKIIRNYEFKQSMRISQTAIEDGKLGDLKQRANNLTRSYHRTRARLAAAHIGHALQGHTTFNMPGSNIDFETKCMDGGCVFSKTHTPKVSGSQQSNLYAAAFSADNLIAAKLMMMDFKDEDGNVLGINPDTILIPMYDPVLFKAVLAAIGSPQVVGSGNNDVSVTYGNWTVHMSSYLNDYVDKSAANTPWILLDSTFNQEADGNVFQDRVALNIRSEIAPNDDNVWKARARFGYGFVNWRQMAAFGITGGSTL